MNLNKCEDDNISIENLELDEFKSELNDLKGNIFQLEEREKQIKKELHEFGISDDQLEISIGALYLNQSKSLEDYLENKIGLEKAKLKMHEQSSIWEKTFIKELFIDEPEGINLFKYLWNHNAKLENLGGKIIKDINLNVRDGLNFCFRGILEFVKSRNDLNFPQLPKEHTLQDEEKRGSERNYIIKEYEKMLRQYIAIDFKKNEDGTIEQIPLENTFDKIFISKAIQEEDPTNVLRGIGKEDFQKFSDTPISEYKSEIVNGEYNNENQFKMIKEIEIYAKEHPTEKILVGIFHHGFENGNSGNGWSKEDWNKIANISPNINIFSVRCYFGGAYDKEIYNNKSELSGFSNNEPTLGLVSDVIKKCIDMGLGFHEMQLYTRLNYYASVTPLSGRLEYNNIITGENEIGNIGLANNGDYDQSKGFFNSIV